MRTELLRFNGAAERDPASDFATDRELVCLRRL
jgi:hypothetical protein